MRQIGAVRNGRKKKLEGSQKGSRHVRAGDPTEEK